MTDPLPYRLTVSRILDKTTIVVAGDNVGILRPEQQLSILAFGPPIPGLKVPLVMRKATVEVCDVTDVYAIAKSRLVEDAASSWAAELRGGARSYHRSTLLVEEKSLLGNPSNQPIQEGDPVIRVDDLQQFVAFLAEKLQK